jgi:hypothetical protein
MTRSMTSVGVLEWDFFAVDADCAGQVSSNSAPWEKNSQWLELLAHSGTPLFIFFPHETVVSSE